MKLKRAGETAKGLSGTEKEFYGRGGHNYPCCNSYHVRTDFG